MGEQLLGSPRPGHGRVFVLCDRHGEWSASWQDDYPDDEVGDAEPDAGVEDFEGTEEEVIRWARSRPAEEFFIFSPEAGDYIPLEPAQELPARRGTASVLQRPFRYAPIGLHGLTTTSDGQSPMGARNRLGYSGGEVDHVGGPAHLAAFWAT